MVVDTIRKFKTFIREIQFANNQNVALTILGYTILIISAVIISMVLSNNMFYAKNIYFENRTIQSILYFFMLIAAINFLFNYIVEILQGREIRLIKKLGFHTSELFMFLSVKCLVPFSIFLVLYSALFSINEFSLITLVLSFVGGVSSFAGIITMIIVYYIYRTKLRIIKNIAVCSTIFGMVLYIWCAISFQSDLPALLGEFIDLLSPIMPVIYFIVRTIFIPSSEQAVFIVVMGTILICCGKRLFNTEFRHGKMRLPKQGTRVIKGNVLTAFWRRDLSYICKSSWSLLQLFFLIVWVFILNSMGTLGFTASIIFAIITVYFNAFFIPELFEKLDEGFANTYRALPLKYSTFIYVRLSTSTLFCTATSVIILLAQLLLGNIRLLELLIVLFISIAFSAVLTLYYTSVMMPYYPKMKHRTQTPLLISLILQAIPPVWPIIIIRGLKKGHKAWYIHSEGGGHGC